MPLPFICPICRTPLKKDLNLLKCRNNHCFDLSKTGYVNLLTGSGKKNHGDDKLMVKARHDFLSKDYYKPLRDKLQEEVSEIAVSGNILLDSGCGEGYYTSAFVDALREKNDCEIFGIDLSKEALKLAAKSCPTASFAAASAYCLPFQDESFDILTSVFSPLALEEFQRVLKKGGIFITVIPLENHLFSLKKAIYDTPYKNRPESAKLEGFELVSSSEVKREITLTSQDDISNLFKMTPYYYKTSAKDQKKLNGIDKLDVETEFMILTYKKSKKSL